MNAMGYLQSSMQVVYLKTILEAKQVAPFVN